MLLSVPAISTKRLLYRSCEHKFFCCWSQHIARRDMELRAGPGFMYSAKPLPGLFTLCAALPTDARLFKSFQAIHVSITIAVTRCRTSSSSQRHMGAFSLPCPTAGTCNALSRSGAQSLGYAHARRRRGPENIRRHLSCRALQTPGSSRDAVVSFGEALFGEFFFYL